MPSPEMAAKNKKKKPSASDEEVHRPEEISPFNIRRNEQNPRIDFPPARIEALADSIEEEGILVPLTVYRDPDGKTEYVLLDGERRWRAAKLINRPSVPAWRIPKPDGVQNVVTMFNIHMMRDDWGEMATALALKKIIEALGTADVEELRRRTGLTKDRIQNIKRVLKFPSEWHEKVLDGTIKFNLLVELDKAVLTKAQDPKKAAVIQASESQLRDIFLRKYIDGSLGDVVDLRKVGMLIDTATSKHYGSRVRARAKRALRELFTKPELTVAEAYQFGAAASVEIKNIIRDLEHLPQRIADVASSDLEPDDRERLSRALNRTRSALTTILKKL